MTHGEIEELEEREDPNNFHTFEKQLSAKNPNNILEKITPICNDYLPFEKKVIRTTLIKLIIQEVEVPVYFEETKRSPKENIEVMNLLNEDNKEPSQLQTKEIELYD